MYEFRWNDWNVGKCREHGVDPAEAEHVVEHAKRPFPRRLEEGKVVVWGQSAGGRYLQVIHVVDPAGTLYVIHARPLSAGEKRQPKRRRR
jgi:uncharacterized DUF497 family protein